MLSGSIWCYFCPSRVTLNNWVAFRRLFGHIPSSSHHSMIWEVESSLNTRKLEQELLCEKQELFIWLGHCEKVPISNNVNMLGHPDKTDLIILIMIKLTWSGSRTRQRTPRRVKLDIVSAVIIKLNIFNKDSDRSDWILRSFTCFNKMSAQVVN